MAKAASDEERLKYAERLSKDINDLDIARQKLLGKSKEILNEIKERRKALSTALDPQQNDPELFEGGTQLKRPAILREVNPLVKDWEVPERKAPGRPRKEPSATAEDVAQAEAA